MKNLIHEKYNFHFFSLLQLLILIILFVLNNQEGTPIGGSRYYFILLIICFLSYFLLYRIIRGIIIKAEEDSKREALMIQKKMQEEHLMAMRQNEKNMIALKDTILNKVYYDKTLQYKGNEEKKEYINSLIMSFSGMKKIDNCKNKVIDAILYNKALLAESRRVPFSVTALVPEDIDIEPIDLMCVFSNLLDNAIDANQNIDVDKRYIHIETSIVTNYLVVIVENAKTVDQKIMIKKHHTSKDDKNSHGLGLSIIQNTCKKNKGNLYIDDEGEKVVIKAILRIKEDTNHDKL